MIDPLRKAKGGPFIGPRGGKWADAKHTIPYRATQASRVKKWSFDQMKFELGSDEPQKGMRRKIELEAERRREAADRDGEGDRAEVRKWESLAHAASKKHKKPSDKIMGDEVEGLLSAISVTSEKGKPKRPNVKRPVSWSWASQQITGQAQYKALDSMQKEVEEAHGKEFYGMERISVPLRIEEAIDKNPALKREFYERAIAFANQAKPRDGSSDYGLPVDRAHARLRIWEKTFEKSEDNEMSDPIDQLGELHKAKGGPFIGPRGGKWADAKHTIPWKEGGGQRAAKAAVKRWVAEGGRPPKYDQMSLVVGDVDWTTAAKIGDFASDRAENTTSSKDRSLWNKLMNSALGRAATLRSQKKHPDNVGEIKDAVSDFSKKHSNREPTTRNRADSMFVMLSIPNKNEYELPSTGIRRRSDPNMDIVNWAKPSESLIHDSHRLISKLRRNGVKDAHLQISSGGSEVSDIYSFGLKGGKPFTSRGRYDESPKSKAGALHRMRQHVKGWNMYKSEDNEMSDPIDQLGALHKAMGGIPSFIQAQGAGAGSSRQTAFGELPPQPPRGGHKDGGKTYTGPKGGRYSDAEHKHSIGKMRGKASKKMLGYLRGVLHAKMKAGKATMADVQRYTSAAGHNSRMTKFGEMPKPAPRGGHKPEGQTFTGPKGGQYSDPEHKHSIGKSEGRMIDPDALSKGMSSFYLTGKGGSLPDNYLAEYLDSFINEAYEHERSEHAHTDPNLVAHSSNLTGYMAQCVFSELMAFIPHNANLKKACTKLKVSREYVEERMRYLNLIHIDSENQNANQKASTSGYHPTPMALSMDGEKHVGFLAEQEHRESMEKAFRTVKAQKVNLDSGPDPMELLQATLEKSEFHVSLARSADGATATLDPNCLFHGRDIHTDPGMFPQSVTGNECTCPK